MASAAYERRIQKYLDAHPGATRKEARGHKFTPERPQDAVKNPSRYRSYLDKHPERQPPMRGGSAGRLTREQLDQAVQDNFDRIYGGADGIWQSSGRARFRENLEDNPVVKDVHGNSTGVRMWDDNKRARAANMSASEWRANAGRAGRAFHGNGPASDLDDFAFTFYH